MIESYKDIKIRIENLSKNLTFNDLFFKHSDHMISIRPNWVLEPQKHRFVSEK